MMGRILLSLWLLLGGLALINVDPGRAGQSSRAGGQQLYPINDVGLGYPGYTNLAGKTEVSCQLDPNVTTAFILGLGQSNGPTSEVDGQYVPVNASAVQNFNFYDGKCYLLGDPVLGASEAFAGGSWIGRLGDKLIDAGWKQRIIFAPIAIHGTSSTSWATGQMSGRALALINRLGNNVPTHIMMMQGETDTIEGTLASAYMNNIQALVRYFRRANITAPFFISQTSYIAGVTSANVRTGQADLVSGPLNIILGPNTDAYTANWRQADNIHWTIGGQPGGGALNGADAVAEVWKTTLAAH